MSNSRRDALAAAFDELESEEEWEETGEEKETKEELESEQPESEVGEETAEEAEETGESEEDSQRIEQEAAARQEGSPTKTGKQSGKPAKTGQAAQQPPGQEQPEVKAPQSWTPAEREHWAKMPKEAQKAVQRRELEIQQALSRSADSRKFQDSFVRTIQPYAHLIRAQNSTPLAAVNNLMQTAAGLMTGTQPQKAAIIAEIIGNYGVDIQTLDDVLSKRPAQQGQQAPAALPQQFAEALRPIHQFMTQQEQARAQHLRQIESQAVQVVEEYSTKLPFFDDLREEMADLMEVAAARGKSMTVEEAHRIAVNANPEVKKILDQRARANKIRRDPGKINRARKAGSSIAGAPNGLNGGEKKPTSRRAALSEAWDDLS